jgi:esterase
MNLFFRKYGEGNPVIILHGLFGMSDNWMTFGKLLAENNLCVYIPDQRNHGESPHSDEFNFTTLSEDLGDFIKRHSLLYPIIIGHSMGGKVAMNFALQHPGFIHKLVVADIGIKKYSFFDNGIIDALSSIDIENARSRSEIENQLLKNIKSKRVALLMMKNVKHIADNRFDWKLDVISIKKNFQHMFERVTSDQQYHGEVLFIRGSLSDFILDEDFSDIRELFPNAAFQTIEGASHWIHADNPIEFLKTIIEFIGGKKKKENI